MSEGERQGSRSTDDGAVGGVLRAVAGAHELVVGGRPGDDAAQVRAHGVEAVGLEGLVFLDDEVAVSVYMIV